MGLLSSFSNWRAERYEKHRTEMESLGMCPECSGKGFMPSYGLEYAAPFDCPGCDGTGLYSDWENNS